MTINGWIQIALYCVIVIALTKPLGGYLARVPAYLVDRAVLDELAARGEFSAPRMETLEAAANYGLGLKRGRVFADLWDIRRANGEGGGASMSPQAMPSRRPP